mgnify:CR=1 FL=1
MTPPCPACRAPHPLEDCDTDAAADLLHMRGRPTAAFRVRVRAAAKRTGPVPPRDGELL